MKMKIIRLCGIIYFVGLALFHSSCTDENESELTDNKTEESSDASSDNNGNQEIEVFTVKANIQDIQQTRATVKPEDGKSFTWQSDDKFVLYQGGEMSAANFAIDNNSITNDGKSANFSCTGFVPTTDYSYFAFYPQEFSTTDNTTITYTIPGAAYNQSGNNNTEHLKTGMIMVAIGKSSELSSGISFSHKTALFRFGVTNLTGDVVTVKSVKLSSTSTKCFARSYSYTVGGSETVGEKSSELNLSFGAGVSVDNNNSLKAYAVAIPADAISAEETFTFEVTYNDNQTKSNSFIVNESFEVGHVYSFNIDIESDVLQVDKIYLAGTAIDGIENVEVTQTLENEKIYAYYDNLKAGTLYLPIEFGGKRNKAIIPNVGGNHDINDGQKQDFSQTNISNVENNYWTIPSEGKYRIVVNIETKEITIYSEEKDMPLREYTWNNTVVGNKNFTAPVEYLWMFGNFRGDAWGSKPDQDFKMTPSKASPYIFTFSDTDKFDNSSEDNDGWVRFLVSDINNNVYAFGKAGETGTWNTPTYTTVEANVTYQLAGGQGANRGCNFYIPKDTELIIVDITDENNPTVIFKK